MTYTERLIAPLGYWVIALFFGLSTVTALTFAFGDGFVIPATLAAAALIAWALISYGSVRVRVDDSGVHAGGALLEWPYVASAIQLGAKQTRELLGAGSDHRAFLVTRPYLREAVQLVVDDAADPHPYWLISTRNPEALVAAVEAQLQVRVKR